MAQELNRVDDRYHILQVAEMIVRGEVTASMEVQLAAHNLLLARSEFCRLTGREP